MRDYTLEQIFEKKLLFLLPFYLFTHEKRFDLYERDAAAMEGLLEDFRTIMRRLSKLLDEGVLDAYTKDTIEMMLRKAIQHLTVKHENVRKGLMKVVGETTLIPHEAWKIRIEGRREGIVATARRMKAGGLPFTQIAEFTGLSIGEIETLEDADH